MRVPPLTAAEIDRLLQAVDREGLLGLRDYALIAFLVDTV
jgi:integrase